MEHEMISYVPLLIIVLLAASVPVVIKKFKFIPFPIVVGEIIAGLIVGKSGFNLIAESPWLNFLYTFGFAFLMFLSGLEIDFDLMRPIRKNGPIKLYEKPVFLGIVIFAGTLLCSVLIAYVLKQWGLITNIILMGLILSTTSLGIVVPILKEKNFINTQYGQTILMSALIADFATMIFITVFVSVYTAKESYKVLLVLLLFVAFFIFYRLGVRIVHNKIIEELAHATAQIKVRGAFALILIFMALAQSLGTEIILGTFLAGIIISLLDEREKSDLYIKLDAIGYGFFVPIFFIMVGANFDLRDVINNPQALLLLPALLVAVYAVKFIPALILRTKYSWKETVAAGFLLSSRLSLIIAASAVGLRLNIITKETNGAVILVAIITCTFSPLLFNRFSPAVPEKPKKKVFIFGVNEKTLLLAKRLLKTDVQLFFIAEDELELNKALQSGGQVYEGNPLDVTWLESIGLREAKTVVAASHEEPTNTEICRICKEVFGIDHLIVLTNSLVTPLSTKLYGARAVSPEFATAFMAENFVTHPQSFCFLFEEDHDDFYIADVTLHNPALVGIPIRKINLLGDCLILSIVRGSEKIIPHGDTVLRLGDLIMLVGTREYVKEVESLFMENYVRQII